MTTLRVARATPARAPVQVATTAVGAAFLVLGILGFVPGIVSDYDGLEFAGHGSAAELFGQLQVSVLHNLFHVAFGIAGLALARTHLAGAFLLCGGAVHLALWVYGVVMPSESEANVVPVNDTDNWVHLGIAAVMITLGLVLEPASRSRSRPREAGTRRQRSPGRSP